MPRPTVRTPTRFPTRNSCACSTECPPARDGGGKKPESATYKEIIEALGLSGWKIDAFEYLDMNIVFIGLSRLEGSISNEAAKRLATAAERVVTASKGWENTTDDYKNEVLAAIDLLCKRAVESRGDPRRRSWRSAPRRLPTSTHDSHPMSGHLRWSLGPLRPGVDSESP